MNEEELIEALMALQAVPTPESLVIAEGFLLGFLIREGYESVVRAYLTLGQHVHGSLLAQGQMATEEG